MPRKPRELKPGYCYHVTTRCNNREFKLLRHECREVFIYVLNKAINKFKFKLYALCIMSNHVHYLIEPKQPEDLPKIMHYINWYTLWEGKKQKAKGKREEDSNLTKR